MDKSKDRSKLQKALKGIKCCREMKNPPGFRVGGCEYCPYKYISKDKSCVTKLQDDIIAVLTAQDAKAVEPKRIELEDKTKVWLDKMNAVEALGNIADICIDWDGYRTADDLGGLINEIWAYARYCADRLLKAQEAKLVHVTAKINYRKIGECPTCGKLINSGDYPNYCGACGQAVKWE